MATLVTTICIAAICIAATAHGAIAIGRASVREPNPAHDIAAAFMTMTNRGDTPVALVGVSSPDAKVVEMHEMKTIDGMMTMRRVDTIVIPPHRSVTLAPGGAHLMLIDLTRTLTAGDKAVIDLKFDDGSRARIEARVESHEATHDH